MGLILRQLRRFGTRRALVMLDQAMSSLSNVVVTIMVARLLAPTQFGAFSLAMVGYQLATGAVRAVVGEPWLSSHSAEEEGERARAMADLVPAALAVSVLCAAVILGSAALAGGTAASALVALGLVFPYLGLQDALRFVSVVDRPQIALASDLAWLAVVVGIVLWAPAGADAEWFVVAWGVGGAVGLVLALVLLRVPLGTGRARRWFTAHREMSLAYLGEYVSARAAGHLVLLAVGAIAGLAALGAVRAAQVFYGPLNTLFAGVYLALVPDGARRRDRPAALMRMMLVATVLVTGTAAGWTIVGLVMPDRLGSSLFGRTWVDAQELMLTMGLATIAGSLATGGFAGLRSLGEARLSLRARLWSLPPQTLPALAGAALGAAAGYAIGLSIGTTVVALIWWSSFAAALRRRQAKHLRKRGRRHRAGRDTPAAPSHRGTAA